MQKSLTVGKYTIIDEPFEYGDDVWIGTNAVVMDDVDTGSNVGAGSVVTEKVGPYNIVAGNPAKVVRKRK